MSDRSALTRSAKSDAKPLSLTDEQRRQILSDYFSGRFYASEIERRHGLYGDMLKRVVEEAGFKY